MELEKQVVSLELAKKLKELGVKQESLFWWRSPLPHHGWPDWSLADGELAHGAQNYSAFTVAELGELLPKVLKYGSLEYELTQQYDNEDGWLIYYEDNNKGETLLKDLIFVGSQRTSEADARASFLVELFENNLLSL